MPRAQQLILLGWVVEGFVLIGLGGLFRRLFRAPARGPEDHLVSLWVGWALLICSVQGWHLFFPVDDRIRIVTLGLGALGLFLDGFAPWRRWLHGAWRNLPLLAVGGLAAWWLSNLSMGGPRFGDSGLYHIPLVRWNVEYPAVPGLGNLFPSFGQAHSHYLYLAWLDVGSFAGRSYHLANGLLLLALAGRALIGIGRLVRKNDACRMADLLYVLFLPGVAEWGLGIFLTSPSPDLAIFALGVVISGELLPFLVRDNDRGGGRFRVCALTLVAATAVTVKLSIAGLSLTAVLLAIIAWMFRERPRRSLAISTVGISLALAALALGPWIAHHVILTGYPFYPSSVAAVPVEWRMRVDAAGWFRQYSMPIDDLSLLWRDPHWVLRHLRTHEWHQPQVLGVLGLTAVAAVAGVLVRLIRLRRPSPARLSAWVLLPAAVSFVSVFVVAQVLRYFGATLWLLAIQTILVGFGDLIVGRRLARAAVLLLVVSTLGVQVRLAREPLRRLRDFETFSRTPVEPVRLLSGLVVQVPVRYDTCWDAPLPCSPKPPPGLRLLREGELRFGFVIDPTAPEP